jgi:hypothetical protein
MAADAGSALRASIAAEAATREIRRIMWILYLRSLAEQSLKASSMTPAGQRAHGAGESGKSGG